MKYTKAMKAFKDNSERLSSLASILLSALKDLTNTLKLVVTNPGSGEDEFNKQVEKLRTSHQQLTLASESLFQWQAVMTVTFTETYLQDVLSEAAALDPTLIKDSKLSATYEEILSADSLELLTLDLRRRWASRNFVDSGPTNWIKRLRQMGAANIDPRLAQPMEELWGIRHLLIHNAGIVTPEFSRIHKGVGCAVGSQITVLSEKLIYYLDRSAAFVNQTDEYLLNRFPALAHDA